MEAEWLQAEQRRTCVTHLAEFLETPGYLKLGLARNARSGASPLNGLRHPPDAGTCGWFIWAGTDLSGAPDFFQPHHVSHLAELLPEVLPYLGLAPGWRFLLEPAHVDVWFDPAVLAPA